jgi:hypothetical protein
MAAIEIMKREIERERWRDRRERRSWMERVEREKDSGGVREWRGVGQRHSYSWVRERRADGRERGSGRSGGDREWERRIGSAFLFET